MAVMHHIMHHIIIRIMSETLKTLYSYITDLSSFFFIQG